MTSAAVLPFSSSLAATTTPTKKTRWFARRRGRVVIAPKPKPNLEGCLRRNNSNRPDSAKSSSNKNCFKKQKKTSMNNKTNSSNGSNRVVSFDTKDMIHYPSTTTTLFLSNTATQIHDDHALRGDADTAMSTAALTRNSSIRAYEDEYYDDLDGFSYSSETQSGMEALLLSCWLVEFCGSQVCCYDEQQDDDHDKKGRLKKIRLEAHRGKTDKKTAKDSAADPDNDISEKTTSTTTTTTTALSSASSSSPISSFFGGTENNANANTNTKKNKKRPSAAA
ncbi:hypothetical protein ACA910_004665 [Epithemia clementina (nom. ined.)]